MNFGLKSKTISFIGLFFLASISLHSFAHIDESPIELNQEEECQSCHNEIASDVAIVSYTLKKTFILIEETGIPKSPDLQSIKPFYSQAPPKIKI